MPIIPLSSELSARIAARIESMQRDDTTPPWLGARAREMNALPLVADMGGSFAIRATGELVQFDWDGSGPAEPLEDARLVNVALYRGSLKFPELGPLVPRRSAGCVDCPHCAGTGKLALTTQPGLEDIVCYCGGVGWLPA